ncbi:unnamed protein product [Sphagnum troendelagicum]|uniref:Uncharacterized protein n=1 Tax=Sphagnum troendelagicum TaxID=128251 RepID=A0ABP0TZH9_9BRYO
MATQLLPSSRFPDTYRVLLLSQLAVKSNNWIEADVWHMITSSSTRLGSSSLWLLTVNFSLLSVTCTILPSCCSVPITVSCLVPSSCNCDNAGDEMVDGEKIKGGEEAARRRSAKHIQLSVPAALDL